MLLMMNLFWRFEINLTLNFLWLKWTVGISISSTTLRAVLQSSEQADFKANLTIFEIGQVKTKGSLQKNKKSGFYPHRLDPPPPPKVYCQETNFKFFLLRRCLLLATIHGFSNSHSKSALGSLQKDSPVYRQKHANHSTFKKHRKQHIQYSNSSKICYSIKKKVTTTK